MKLLIVALIVLIELIENVRLEYSGCDYFQPVELGKVYSIGLERNSQNSSKQISCRWAAEAPPGYKLSFDCLLPQTSGCFKILVSRSGRTDLKDAKRYYRGASFGETSKSTKITVALKIGSFSEGENFKCLLKAVTNDCRCGQVNRRRIGLFK